MRKIISFMHISLDGFVAGINGEMDWIKVNEELFSYVGSRISEGDTALYGRVTFEMMEGYWPTAADQPNASQHDIEHSKWYANVHKIVLSQTLSSQDFSNTEIISENVAERIKQIKQQPGGEILLFGSPSVTHFLMQQNLIDGFWLFVNPVVLGEGIPLFTKIKNKINLRLLNSHSFSNGVTELSYILAE